MVNYGVSRACLTCKKRRKKCDEARPSCARCTKAKLECPGYEDESNLRFRHCIVNAVAPAESWLRKGLSLPSGSIHGAGFDKFAVNEFFYDYCIIPADPFVSRGYLAGLEMLLAGVDPSSDVATATKTAAFASLANKYRDTHLSERARSEYSKLLISFSATMSKPESANTLESITTAVLLGIYEMISASKEHPGEHRAHCRGLAAILSSNSALFSKHPIKLFQLEGDLDQSRCEKDALLLPHDLKSMISPPDPGPSVPSLDTLLQCYAPMFRRGRILTSDLNTSIDELQQFREYAMSVDQEFALWPSKQPISWQPKVLGAVDPAFKNGLLPGLTSSPVRIDVYLDLYVSFTWNAFRKCRIVLLSFIHQCSVRLKLQNIDFEEEYTPEAYRVNSLIELAKELSQDIAASIPFHLVRNPEMFLKTRHQDPPQIDRQEALIPNASAGGLLIMHVILVTSMTTIVPQQIRQSFREYLYWIGQVMGIGQAEVFSDPLSSFEREFILDGHVLVAAGMVIP